MSASRKNTSKSAASPAPATKTASVKTVAKIKSAPATLPAAAPASIALSVPSSAPTPTGADLASVSAAPASVIAAPASVIAAPAALPKPLKSEPVLTTLSARVDVGFGNILFVRGQGAGLSWEQGAAMECVDNDLWRLVLTESASAYTFKFLLNDITWSTGPDFKAAGGTSVTLTPEF